MQFVAESKSGKALQFILRGVRQKRAHSRLLFEGIYQNILNEKDGIKVGDTYLETT